MGGRDAEMTFGIGADSSTRKCMSIQVMQHFMLKQERQQMRQLSKQPLHDYRTYEITVDGDDNAC